MVKPTIDVDDREFRRLLQKLQKEIGDLRPVFSAVRDDWYKNNRTLFTLKSPGKYPDYQGERGPDGQTPYMRWKTNNAIQKSPYPMLKAKHGRIESGLTDKGSQYTVNEMTKNSLTLGVKDIVYARRHQVGYKMPKRPFIFNAKTGGYFYQLQMQRWKDIATETLKRRLMLRARALG